MTSFSLETQDYLTWLSAQRKGSFRLLLLDPPYNVGFRYRQFRDRKFPKQYFHEQMLVLTHCAQLLQEGGSVIYFNYPEMAAHIWAGVDFLDPVKWTTWVYNSHLTGKPLRRASRACLWFSKGKPIFHMEAFQGEYRNPRDPRIMERIAQGKRPMAYDWMEMEPVKNSSMEKRNHPCPLPERMVEEIILGTTNPGDLVGDCYTGSGTTALCALKHGRRFAGCELDPAYVQVAREAVARCQPFDGAQVSGVSNAIGGTNLRRKVPDQPDNGINDFEKPQALLGALSALGGSKGFGLRSGGRSDLIRPMSEKDFEKHLKAFTKDLEVRNYSPYSIQKYGLCLRKFLGWLEAKGLTDMTRGGLPTEALAKVGKGELRAYAETVTDTPGISTSYVCANIRAVKLFFRYLKKTGAILFDLSSCLNEPKQPKTLPKEPLTAQEVKAMLEAPDLRTPLGIRDRAILETFYSTGIRLQEMVNLTLQDLDLEGGYLSVREGKWKKDRTVPLGKHACLFIKTYLACPPKPDGRRGEGPRGLLLAKEKTARLWISKRGKPLGKMDVGNMVRHYRKVAGIEKAVMPHAFRRTLAVELIRNECDFLAVKEILGHSKSETTLRYCALSGVDLKEAHKKSHPRYEAEEPEEVEPKIRSVV